MGKSSKAEKKLEKGDCNERRSSVAEATYIRISRILEQFKTSNDEVYTFDAGLSNHERAMVHEFCRKMGMLSKSYGRGNQRRVSVRKPKIKVDTMKGKEITTVTFSDESKVVLLDLFMRYPPGEEAQEPKLHEHIEDTKKEQGRRDDIFCKPLMNKSYIAKKMEELASSIQKSPKLKEITEERSKLPIAYFQDVIASTVETHQVVLISGQTGCGKTTQVPQFILNHMWAKGEVCKIVCTQPRRISATSVAERISNERGENVGESVGFKIRLESKGGRHSSILLCTNGVLLRVLVSKGIEFQAGIADREISDMTHIIVVLIL